MEGARFSRESNDSRATRAAFTRHALTRVEADRASAKIRTVMIAVGDSHEKDPLFHVEYLPEQEVARYFLPALARDAALLLTEGVGVMYIR